MNTLKLIGLMGLASFGAILSQTGDAEAVACTTATHPFHNGAGGLKCCNPVGAQTQACGNLQANVNDGAGCNVSGVGRRVSAGRMTVNTPEGRTVCLNGGAGPTTTLSDFSANGINASRCDVGNNCAGASNFRVQSF
jgi:hypothetical protein